MSYLPALDPASLHGKAKTLLDAVHAQFGVTPNVFRVVANSPAALEGLLGLHGALAGGDLPAPVRTQLALAVSQNNGCDYCVSAHSALGQGAGFNADEIAAARAGRASDPKTEAAVHFAQLLNATRGKVSPEDLNRLRAAGVSDGEIVEIIGHVALNVFTNYVNSALDTEIDFPVVRASDAAR